MVLTPLKCACGCGRPVDRRSIHGPAPRYASGACRLRAYRQRKAASDEPAALEPFEGAIRTAALELSAAPIDEQIERGLLEARGLGTMFLHLGVIARPEYRWRCARLGEAILAALSDSFREVDP